MDQQSRERSYWRAKLEMESDVRSGRRARNRDKPEMSLVSAE